MISEGLCVTEDWSKHNLFFLILQTPNFLNFFNKALYINHLVEYIVFYFNTGKRKAMQREVFGK